MPKMSTFQLVVLMPLLVALGFFSCSVIQKAIFRDSIARFGIERRQEGFVHLANIEMRKGTAHTLRLLREIARQSDNVFLDSNSRCVQIIKADTKRQSDDGIAMYTLGSHRLTKCIYGLSGLKIREIRFEGDDLIICCFGTFSVDGRVIESFQAKPDEYVIHWPQGSAPPCDQELTDLILDRYRPKSSH